VEKDVELTKERLATIDDTLTYNDLKFATKSVVKVINERLDTFANLEHIDQLKNVLLPRVAAFSD
jgi:hypothetical protein